MKDETPQFGSIKGVWTGAKCEDPDPTSLPKLPAFDRIKDRRDALRIGEWIMRSNGERVSLIADALMRVIQQERK